MRHHAWTRYSVLCAIMTMAIFMPGCRRVYISADPNPPVQGDLVKITINADDSAAVSSVAYTINGTTDTATRVPVSVWVTTCKNTIDRYLTCITVSATVNYNDNGVEVSPATTFDLTCCAVSRKTVMNTYAVYKAQNTSGLEKTFIDDMAGSFMDEFGSFPAYSLNDAEPDMYTREPKCRVNCHDLNISFGHGMHHTYSTGAGDVDLSQTAFGGASGCRNIGEARYLVFCSCQTLSMEDADGQPWSYFWRHHAGTAMEKRPFSGLHMAAGFRTNFVIDYYWFFGTHHNGDEFLAAFADNLDAGMRFVDAWQEAVGDELNFDDNTNMGTVFFLGCYHDEKIIDRIDDYLYGNGNYSVWYDRWE